jgi:thymidylate synthase (FAD)
MSVKLISVSKPAVEGVENAEDLVAYCARVSNPSNQMNTETAPRLLRYLIKHKHWSPLEMVSMTLELKTSRAIAAQILRHRSFSFQEFSQRYSESTILTPIEYRKQGKTNRQVGDEPFELKDTNEFLINSIMEKNLELYNDLINEGVAKECARMVLPLCTETTMYMAGTLRSWVHYIDLRTQQDTQKEHRIIAEGCRDIFIEQFPVVAEALEWK